MRSESACAGFQACMRVHPILVYKSPSPAPALGAHALPEPWRIARTGARPIVGLPA
jgi:hypothetical protein